MDSDHGGLIIKAIASSADIGAVGVAGVVEDDGSLGGHFLVGALGVVLGATLGGGKGWRELSGFPCEPGFVLATGFTCMLGGPVLGSAPPLEEDPTVIASTAAFVRRPG